MSSKRSIAECLVECGISDPQVFHDLETVEDEFKIIKKSYFRQILTKHPDKGGDAEVFKKTQTSFEIIRDLFRKEGLVSSFADYFLKSKKDVTADTFDDIFQSYDTGEVPSYEYYEEAAEEEMPLYRVEKAKSGRSQCVKCKKPAKKKAKQKSKANKTSKSIEQEAEENSPAATCSSTAVVNKFIPKDSLRFGRLMNETGTYTNWHHLLCWRVPSKVWTGFTMPEDADVVLQDLLRMDEVLLSGVDDLTEEEKREVIEHVMNRNNWTKKIMKKKAIEDANDQDSKKRVADETDKENKRPKIEDDDDALNDNIKFAASSTNSAAIATMKQDTSIRTEDALNDDSKVAASSISSTAIIATMKQDSSTRTAIAKIKQRFTIPKPGENGAVENTKLKDKRFVMTGTFPEVGGGAGLGLGKDKTKKMIESFGGKVTSAVSGKTDYLIIGMEPGASKVGKAKSKGVTMMDLRTIQQLLMGETDFENIDLAPPPAIESFSKGYQRGRALLE